MMSRSGSERSGRGAGSAIMRASHESFYRVCTANLFIVIRCNYFEDLTNCIKLGKLAVAPGRVPCVRAIRPSPVRHDS